MYTLYKHTVTTFDQIYTYTEDRELLDGQLLF